MSLSLILFIGITLADSFYDSLFDMDGTLVDSTAGVEGAWDLFRETYPSIDVQNILSCEHCIATPYIRSNSNLNFFFSIAWH